MKPEKEMPIERIKLVWEDNIKMNLKGIGVPIYSCEGHRYS